MLPRINQIAFTYCVSLFVFSPEPHRQDSEYIKEVIKPFDWTFTTDYKGTLTGKEELVFQVWF